VAPYPGRIVFALERIENNIEGKDMETYAKNILG
jgi:hypothetical protein